jgi:hypothetical protein
MDPESQQVMRDLATLQASWLFDSPAHLCPELLPAMYKI